MSRTPSFKSLLSKGTLQAGVNKLLTLAKGLSLTAEAYKMMQEADRRVSKVGRYRQIVQKVLSHIPKETAKDIKSDADAIDNSVMAAQSAFYKLNVKVKNVEDAENAEKKAAFEDSKRYFDQVTFHKDAARRSAKSVRSALKPIVKNVPEPQKKTLSLVLNWVDVQIQLVHNGKPGVEFEEWLKEKNKK